MSTLTQALMPPIEIRSPIQAWQAILVSCRQRAERSAPGSSRAAEMATFRLTEHVGSERAAVESFISRCFAESFGSRIDAFMPRLFSVRDHTGKICGAFGLRSGTRKLFLEQYLDEPIEQAVAAFAGSKPERRTIVEVGHFCGSFPGAVRAMISLLTGHLHHEGFEWVAFTGTTGLRNAFCRLGLSPFDIQAASASRLPPESRAAWGSYYDHGPRVLIGNILEGYRAMRAAAQPDSTEIEVAA